MLLTMHTLVCLKWSGGGDRRPAPWGQGRSGWAAAHGCAGRRPVSVCFLDWDSLRACAVGSLWVSSGSEAAGPEAAAGWADCVSLASR